MDTETKNKLTMSRALAPEDVRPGQYVCVLSVLNEYLPYWALFEESWKTPEPIRLSLMPADAGTPLRVTEVCLPFLLVEKANGTHCTLDLRRHQLARVSKRFGNRAFKRLRRSPAEESSIC